MKLSEITTYLETIAPLALQENYDNCGLLTGNPQMEISAALVTLDCTEEVVDEAIAIHANLIVAHHPIVFSGLKKITGKNYVERVIIKAIQNNIAIYAIHTNLDNVQHGVNAEICKRLGLQNCKILSPKNALLRKLVTFIPTKNFEQVAQAVFAAGAGNIGNYSETGFSVEGIGTFKGNENTNPAIGQKGVKEQVNETRFETIFPAYLEHKVIQALLSAHPYEEVAYDIYPLNNTLQQIGSGMVGILPKPMSENKFLKLLKEKMLVQCVRHTNLLNKQVTKVALCGGSGSFLLSAAIASGADFYVTGDFKYHEFFDAENKIVIADIGHYESEQFTKDLLFAFLNEKFPTFALHLSRINTNPVKYF
ncbi:MAG TPA: Nif3-like dinuclear metal center hexameric protein [Chitinophagales bacterium]|nr:MAG: Nif3-like dinuclear metal center hexameric protein [Bacteroidetes bacterium 37-13]HRN93179.1 Nif3-like dinuclear metal center hexameric protein [Chitinophagales bacterium]HRP38830.1 Nif3-like dinuclear metal center hexameric protein [Chitinophagales bacterium]